MEVLAGTLAALLAAVVLLLVMPLRLALRFGSDPVRFDLRLAPFGGFLGWVNLPRRPSRAPPRSIRAPGKTPGRRPAAAGMPLLRALPAFLSALADRIRIDRLRLDLRFGTGDPALTGQVYGWLMPLVHGVGGASVTDLRILPDFDRACLSGRAEVVLRLTPLRLAGPLFRLWRAGQGWR